MLAGWTTHIRVRPGGINPPLTGNRVCMSAAPFLRQPLAAAVAGAPLAPGVTGTVWATSSADSSRPRPPAQTSPPTR
jgi:hypothetical protein